jgi:hypothetical protein
VPFFDLFDPVRSETRVGGVEVAVFQRLRHLVRAEALAGSPDALGDDRKLLELLVGQPRHRLGVAEHGLDRGDERREPAVGQPSARRSSVRAIQSSRSSA